MAANAEGPPVSRTRNAGGNAVGGTPNVPKKNNLPTADPKRSEPAVTAGNVGKDVGNNVPTQSTNNDNDTFNKHYNKELRVSKDEIPIVMAELNDSAYRFMKRE